MHLGVFAIFVAHALWRIIDANVWGGVAGLTLDAAREKNALRMRHELGQWYKARKREAPYEALYELQDSFSLKMLGPAGVPLLHAKAADTGTLVYFTAELCSKYEGVLPCEGRFGCCRQGVG